MDFSQVSLSQRLGTVQTEVYLPNGTNTVQPQMNYTMQ
jgi:hypothetical protein